MATVEVAKFIELVKQSQLADDDELTEAMAGLAEINHGRAAQDADTVADQLVNLGLLSRWQADCLLEGEPQQLRIGKYRLLRPLGTGGMSTVYLAEHEFIRRRAAIKVLPEDAEIDASSIERFRREARAAAALDHPNIVRVDDVVSEEQTHYIVMEYVPGRDLQTLVQEEGPLGYEIAADYVAQIADALQHAHDAGLVHRDIKPANCLASENGIVKIVDLGLAKLSEAGFSLTVANDERLLGTVDYLAPEQAVDSHAVDSRADIYSLGGTLYFLLTGHPPFPDGSMPERLIKHQHEMPKSIYLDRPDAPPELVELCNRMMVKEPAERIQTALEIENELTDWLVSRSAALEGLAARVAKASESSRQADESTDPFSFSDDEDDTPTGLVNPDTEPVTTEHFAKQELKFALADDESNSDGAVSSPNRKAKRRTPQTADALEDELTQQQIALIEQQLEPLDQSPEEALLAGAPVQVASKLLPPLYDWRKTVAYWGTIGLVVLICLVLFFTLVLR